MAKKGQKTDTPADNAPKKTAEETAGETFEQLATPNPEQPPLSIAVQYIKDLSFESPNAPGILGDLQNNPPDVNIDIDVRATPLEGGVYEVVLHINAQCKSGDKVAFVMELAYGGIFQVNVPPEHLQPMLLIECPRMLFPFARNILSEVTRDGGFPPLMLAPVDFVAMYQNSVRREAEEAGTDKGGNGGAAE